MKKTINSIALVLLALAVLVSALAFSSCTDVQAAQGEPDAEVNAEVPDTDVDVLGGIGSNAVEEADEETTLEEETTAAPAPDAVPEEPVAPAEPTEPTVPSADPVIQEPEANIDTSAPSQDLINRIIDDYDATYFDPAYSYDKTRKSILWNYYGSCNGNVAVMIYGKDEGYTHALWDDHVAGSVIHYHDGNQILIWNDGEFYWLNAAYEKGILSKGEIALIAEINNNGSYIKFR